MLLANLFIVLDTFIADHITGSYSFLNMGFSEGNPYFWAESGVEMLLRSSQILFYWGTGGGGGGGQRQEGGVLMEILSDPDICSNIIM